MQNEESFTTAGHLEPSRHEPYRMRCPHCRKLYSVETQLIETAAGSAKFECVSCQTPFVAFKNEGHGGSTLETQVFDPSVERPNSNPATDSEHLKAPALAATIAIPLAGRECPKCHAINAKVTTECRSCGIVFARYKASDDADMTMELELAGSAELIGLWDELLHDYQNLPRHEAFIASCASAGRLPFASRKYAQVLASAPTEELSRKMRRRVIGLASVRADHASPALETSTWKFPLPSFNNFIVLLGTIAILVGFGLPNARDLAGVGGAMIALALGLRYFLRRP